MKVFYTSEAKRRTVEKAIGLEAEILNAKIPKRIKNPKDLFKHHKELIDKSDAVVVDLSSASIDIGGMVVYALTKDIPVLALLYEESKDTITPMLAGNPSDSLFIEHYNDSNIQYVVRDFFRHIKSVKGRKGHFIVIDGGDGSGKATQTKLLSEYFVQKKIPHRVYDFPRYYSSFHGAVVGRMLTGEFGTLDSLSPYLSSLAYALDRASVKEEMYDFLRSGGNIISNRYVSSSMAFQGAKFENPLEQKKYLEWLYDLEYKVHRIPHEDIVIYLHVPAEISRELTLKKNSREYTKGKKLDIHEANLTYQKTVENLYISLVAHNPKWRVIECINAKGKMKTPAEIHHEIISVLTEARVLGTLRHNEGAKNH